VITGDLEIGMATADYNLESLARVKRQVGLLIAATGIEEIIGAARAYLASWPKDRIEKLQKIDGGWGTFDYQGRPIQIHGMAYIAQISDVLGRHCLALKDAGIDPTPELLELDLYFALAKQIAENLISVRSSARVIAPRSPDNRRRSDRETVPV
jgi:hypothetical protein